ncbi:MAG: FAD:protein FMN transferase [Succinivibrionaceae bacterium]|nr:FAD:protein FMN transferase [Succinivibrionaceae bacterium]
MSKVLQKIFRVAAIVAIFGTIAYVAQKHEQQVAGAAQDPVAVAEKRQTVEISGPIFGTFFGITVAGDYPGGEAELMHDAMEVLNRINAEISAFDPNSELSRFNRLLSTDPFPVSEDTALMIAESFRAGRELQGVMDITVGPLVNLWGFGRDRKPEGYVPSDEEIAATRAQVGLDKLHLEYGYGGSFLRKDLPAMRIDLATVGEGFAADALAKMLDAAGIGNYLVHVAGAMRTRGRNPSGLPWKVAIEQPVDVIGAAGDIIDIQNRAVSTAGTYRNYFEKDGRRYSHAIDPRSGKPVEHNTVSVTVIGDSALFTDAMDTGLLVLGADEALRYANERGLAIYCIVKEPEGFRARWSRAFRQYLAGAKGKPEEK